MYLRKQVFEGIGTESAFLWGARQTGKSTLLKALFPGSLYFDFLLSDVYDRFQRNPALLREIIQAALPKEAVIIDEPNMTKSANFDSQEDDIILSWSSM